MAGFETLAAAAAAEAILPTASSFALAELAGGGTVAGFNAATAAAGAAGVGGTAATLNAAGNIIGAGGQIISGVNAKARSREEAAEYKRIASEERAAAQRKAQEKRRQMNLLLSRSQAVSAASGAGATDPTVLAIEGGIQQEGEYQAGVENYLGETRAGHALARADMAREEGDDALTGSLFSAGGTILSGMNPYYTRYNRPGTSLRYG